MNETIEIIVNKLFPETDYLFNNSNKSDFRKLLQLAVQDTAFIFNNNCYSQIDGMAMDSPLGSIFADIFMCSLEEHFLDTCPLSNHPLFCKRYVDDTFALF